MCLCGQVRRYSASVSSPGLNLLPDWVSVIWLALLVVVLGFHLTHLRDYGAQHRAYYCAHIMMLLGMIYMYGSMAFGWSLILRQAWMLGYSLTSAAIAAWLVVRFVTRRPVSFLWVFAMLGQLAMVYMWAPLDIWVPWLSYLCVGYFALEALAWVVGFCDDAIVGRGVAVGPGDRDDVVAICPCTAMGNASMALMVASMSFMFLAMQLMS